MKILAIVVTFYPEEDLLMENINSFINDVERILIWENTPEVEKKHYRFLNNQKIEYCGDGINSISRALNFGWHYAQANGYDYLLTMDQDSLWINFSAYLDVILKKEIPFGLYGPNLSSSPNNLLYRESASIITSGSLVSIDILNKIGGYYEGFDIEGVDIEFCYRAKTYGIPAFIVYCGHMIQKFGAPQNVTFLGSELTVSRYSSQRRYNMAKSKAILIRKYKFSLISRLKLYYVEFFIKPILILIGETDKIKKICATYKGFMDGLKVKGIGYKNHMIEVI